MRPETIAAIRTTALGLTGLGCLAYGLAALVLGRPDPVAWYWPSVLGLLAAAVISVAFMAAGRAAATASKDELYRLVWRRASAQAYWASLAIFALFAVLGATGQVVWPAAVAAMGCLMGASFLCLFVLHDLRMR
ncbi:hypothetical protein [Pararhodobacter zhoushanensis]|uniref:DUF2178 domain-containing protein n=1 Tax=Pararhodobacter zhoushanensis TaxID=2479545 RepID=A0ABT3GYU3_9RHOB|nr:hypothetical protein [Pararhodobacter zhoushanensis]MCW1932723.1 hypothetical protein [Pararhodobacter zhoushanensis]